MHRGGFWIIWVLLVFHSFLIAKAGPILQKTKLPNASIIDSSDGNVRKIEITFGSRQLVSEQLIDSTSRITMASEFGANGGDSVPMIDGKAILHASFQQRLESPMWILDGKGNGFYMLRQPNFQVMIDQEQSNFKIVELENRLGTNRKWTRLQFTNTSADEMAKAAGLMENPVLAPLQITENDDAGMIVYDMASKTTAYVITNPSERMNSAGYLNGCRQPCVVLVRVIGDEMVFSAGKATESGTIRLKFFGDWQPSSSEKALLNCVQKAGRTWVEFTPSPEGGSEIKLHKMPDKGILQRIYEVFKGS